MKVIRLMVIFILLGLAGVLPAREKITLAVLDFDAKNTSVESASAVTDLLRTELFNSGRLIVVERDKIVHIIEEQQFQTTGHTDMVQAVEIGRLLNVQKILAGSVNRLGETYVLNARMVDVQSGVVDLAVSKKATGGEGDLPDTIVELGAMIVDRIGIEGAIIRVDGDQVMVDLGNQDGVRLGQVFDVLRKGETIKNLQGRVIGTKFDEVGSIELMDVDDGFAEGKTRQGAGALQVGDRVRSVAAEADLGENYPIEGVYYQVIGMHSEKGLDVRGTSTSNKAEIQIYAPQGKDNQLWLFVRTGQYYKIMSKLSGKCLDIKDTSTQSGAPLQQYACHGRDNQLWKLEPVGDYFKIISKHSSKCIDVKDYSKENKADVQQYTCHGGSNQLWKLLPEGE